MDLMAIIFLPPIVAFLALVFWSPGAGYLASLALVVGLSVITAVDASTSKASGPDDWYHGIHALPAMACLAIALGISIAQGIRWWRERQGLPGRYVLWLVLVGAVGVLLGAVGMPLIAVLGQNF